jgi:hypothetical protein
MVFPAIRYRRGSSEEYIIPIIKTESEGNYIRVRRGSTKKREVFTLIFRTPNSDYETIKGHFNGNQGSSFTWLHQETGITHIVVYGMDRLKRSMFGGYSEYTVILEEL